MKQFSFIFIISTLFACTTKIETEYKDVEALRASTIYQSDSVFNYIEKFHDKNKEMASSYLKQADEVAKNNIAKATYFTKRAITIYPILDNYLLLAKLLEKSENYKELATLYQFITRVQYKGKASDPLYVFEKPSENLFYESVVADILAYNYLYFETAYEIKELGYDVAKFKERIQNEPRIKIDKKSEQFKYLLLQFLPHEEVAQYAKKPEVFSEFLASLKDTLDLFEINEETIEQFNYEDFNGINFDGEGAITFSYVYGNYLFEKQNQPDKWFQYNYLRRFKLNDNVIIIEYAIDSSATACPKDMRHIYHRIVTYDNNVKLLDSKVIAIQSGEQLVTASFNKNNFVLTESKRVWKKTYDKNNFDNDLLSVRKIGTSSFFITDDGIIKEVLN